MLLLKCYFTELYKYYQRLQFSEDIIFLRVKCVFVSCKYFKFIALQNQNKFDICVIINVNLLTRKTLLKSRVILRNSRSLKHRHLHNSRFHSLLDYQSEEVVKTPRPSLKLLQLLRLDNCGAVLYLRSCICMQLLIYTLQVHSRSFFPSSQVLQ